MNLEKLLELRFELDATLLQLAFGNATGWSTHAYSGGSCACHSGGMLTFSGGPQHKLL
jgi:hypothetical protein